MRNAPALRAAIAAGLLGLPALASAAELGGEAAGLVGHPVRRPAAVDCPLPAGRAQFWHHHYGKIAAAWRLAFLVPCALFFGGRGRHGAVHAFVAEFIPFIILITALFMVAGGICVRGNLHGTPALNTGILAIGTLLASFMGTTGAAMLMIRPMIRANDNRKHAAHIVVFFIFLVANAGGSLTPLGDPPLFLGFLKGVDFFWTARHIFPETLFLRRRAAADFLCARQLLLPP